ncbi:MAG: ApaG domain [Verrucomicrobiota bacterium]|nr:ApaG domain [Verrucomicrobiota bacterium]
MGDFIELPGLFVTIDKVVHMPQLDAPPERPYPFAYFLTIHNESDRTVTIKGRKWVVTDETGDKLVVEADGVVGKTPRLESGQSFTYNSYHTILHNSVAEGAYLGIDEEGNKIVTRIPRFELTVPE